MLLAAMVVAVLAAFGMAACGDDNGGSSEDEDQITAAIERAATSGDPAACTEVETPRFVQETSGEPGDSPAAAIKSCEQDASETPADQVDVTDIEVEDDTATAQAAVTGSFFDGQTLDLALVKEGDQWKLDQFKGFVDFSRDAMADAIGAALTKEEGANQQAVDCVDQQIHNLPEDQVEAAFAGNDPQAEDRIFEPCAKFFEGG
jgi:hypothetical protein